MSQVISFFCTSCQMAYKVKSDFAGRKFACKKCNAPIQVPQTSQPAMHPAPNVRRSDPALESAPPMDSVDMAGGAEVIRKATSSQRAAVAPTQAFQKHRESGRRPGISRGATQPAKKGPPVGLIAGVVGGLLAVIIAVVVIVVMTSDNTTDGSGSSNQVADKPSNDSAPQDTRSKGQKLLMEVRKPSTNIQRAIAIYKEAQGKDVSVSERSDIAREVATKIDVSRGEGLTSSALIELAKEFSAAGEVSASHTLANIVVARKERENNKWASTMVEAQRLLGRMWVDFDAIRSLADDVVDSGLGDLIADELKSLHVLENNAVDDGWVSDESVKTIDDVTTAIADAKAELDRIKKEDPFALVVRRELAAFKKTRAGRYSDWTVIGTAPLLWFIELQDGESEDDAKYRLESEIEDASRVWQYLMKNVADANGLKRQVPADVSQSERDELPIRLFLFNNDKKFERFVGANHAFTDWPISNTAVDLSTGDAMVSVHNVRVLRPMLGMQFIVLFNEDLDDRANANLRCMDGYWSRMAFPLAMYYAEFSDDPDDPNLYATESKHRTRLRGWNKPFTSNGNNIPSFGGPSLTLKQVIEINGPTLLKKYVRENLEKYEGWSDAQLTAVADSTKNANEILKNYHMALAEFCYHFERGGKHVYRDKMFAFFALDIQGKVDHMDPTKAFAKVFDIKDQAGWDAMQKEFLDWQNTSG